MRKQPLIIIIFLCILHGCNTQNEQRELITFDLKGVKDSIPLILNDCASDLRLIRLESNEKTYIRNFQGHVGENYIVQMGNDKIVQFTADGKLIGTIAKKGNGPEEFKNIGGWVIDKKGEGLKNKDLSAKNSAKLQQLNGEISENDNPIIITGKWKTD